MSVAWHIVLERKIVGFDERVNGKALGRAGKTLELLAKELGVPGLLQFYSAGPEELEAFAQDHGVDLEKKGISLAREKWFEAEDGLRSVRVLIKAGERNGVERPDTILAELREFEKVLETAKKNGVRWHLAVDY